MILYTSRMGYEGKDRVDITVESGNRFFSPSWAMVTAMKRNNITQSQFTELYYRRLKLSLMAHPDEWEKLLSMEQATLVCFCKSDTFCHRYILANLLQRLTSVDYRGERGVYDY